MAWWLQNNLRMIQNNLRDIDAGMDVDAWFAEIESSHCNCVMVGAGGITSFYPTNLPYQTRSPYLKGDLLGEIVRVCHAHGVRVIARFDFSKTHERLLAEHPEWYYVSEAGEHLHYNDTAATCVCGEYQQRLSIEILREVLENYPVDGIFFNMFGFQTKDYSNVEHGICNCPACRKAYLDYCGRDLPQGQDWKTDETYAAFKEQVVGDLLLRIRRAVKAINPEVAICTYHHKGVDIIREESNSAVDRPLPFFLYSASENCQSAAGSWGGEKTMLNCAINAVDIFYRFQGVSPELTKIRLYENMAAGSQLDFCIIGDFADYPDRAGVAAMREVFGVHARNEALYGKFQSLARVLLYRPRKGDPEYLGWFNLLKEGHVLFDVLDHPAAVEHPERAAGYAALIVPDPARAPAAMLRAARESGAKLLFSGLVDGEATEALRLLGVEWRTTLRNTRAAYLSTADKTRFPSFPDRDWVILDREFGVFSGAQGALPLVHSAMFGPPERCFGHETGEEHGLLRSADGTSAAFAFRLGRLYRDYGYADHRLLALDALRDLAPEAFLLRTNAPTCVEVFWNGLPDGRMFLQLLNLSGFNGVTVEPCIPVPNVEICLPCAVTGVHPLEGAPQPAVEAGGAQTRLRFAPLARYQAFVLDV